MTLYRRLSNLVLVLLVIFIGSAQCNSTCPAACKCPIPSEVHCSGAKLDRIPDGIPQTVHRLYLDNNNIQAITGHAFKGLLHLNVLDLSDNQLTYLNGSIFQHSPLIGSVDFAANKIGYIGDDVFVNLLQLIGIDLADNHLTEIPKITNVSKLQRLNLQNNFITELRFRGTYENATDLNSLILSHNSIASISAETFKNLTNSPVATLWMASNRMSSIESAALGQLTHLQSLRLSGNPLSLVAIRNVTESLKNCSSLLTLELEYLNLNGPLTADIFDPIRTLPKLQSVKFEGNNINAISAGTFANMSIQYLLLPGCKIETIGAQAFANMSKLLELVLHDNRLTKIPSDLPSSLQSLDLSSCNITTLDQSLSGGMSLETLNLRQNHITEIQNGSLDNLGNLRRLDLSLNAIHHVSPDVFSSLKNLLTLLLNNNSLDFDPGQAALSAKLVNLQDLFINGNNLTHLSSDMFSNLQSLQRLHLSSNRIATWTGGLSEKLVAVDLSNNRISVVNVENLINTTALRALNMTGNPFACTCNLTWFRQWLASHKNETTHLTEYKCTTPKSRVGVRLEDIDVSQLGCNPSSVPSLHMYAWYVVAGTCVVVLLIACLLLVHCRWQVRYFFYGIGTSETQKEYLIDPHRGASYDLYISCDPSDHTNCFALHNWMEKKGYRVSFEPNWHQAEKRIAKITESISRSIVTLFVLSERYIRSPRFAFEFQLVLKQERLGAKVALCSYGVLDRTLFSRGNCRLPCCRQSEELELHHRSCQLWEENKSEEFFASIEAMIKSNESVTDAVEC